MIIPGMSSSWFPLSVFLAASLLLGCSSSRRVARAKLEGPPTLVADGGSVKGLVYRKSQVREVHLPGRNLSFMVGRDGHAIVFRPDEYRYQVLGKMPFEYEGKVIQMPVWHAPGQEPRFVGEIEVRTADADAFSAFLANQEAQQRRLQALAGTYLPSDVAPRAVARWRTANAQTDAFVRKVFTDFGYRFTVMAEGEWTSVWTEAAPYNGVDHTMREVLEREAGRATDWGATPREGRANLDFELIPARRED